MFKLTLIFALLNFSELGRSDSPGGHTAVVTRLKGSAVIFTNSPQVGAEQAHHVTFEGENYLETEVKPGSKLGKGDVIQTGADSQVRLIFKNGDSLSLGPASSYKINWTKDDSAPIFNVFYGKVRGIFKKDGPRTGTVVQTKTSVMGVRGTDFYVTVAGSTAVSVLRGEVNLRANRPGAKEVSLQTGFTAKVEAPPTPKTAPAPDSGLGNGGVVGEKLVEPEPEQQIAITPTSRVELIDIQTKSTIKAPAGPTGVRLATIGEGERSEVEGLERQATETIMSDIKITDPVLYDQISSSKVVGEDMDNVNTVAVGELFKKAPNEKKSSKPGPKELEGLGNDAYDRYFKVE